MLEGVAATALGVAMARASESDRPDRLFTDPTARVFLDATDVPTPGVDALDPQVRAKLTAMYGWIVARTRFLDDVCDRAIRAGVRQAVILGAGLDGRAFRLRWAPDTTLFEVDRCDVLDFKEGVLAESELTPACDRRVVVADLAEEWTESLRERGFDASEPTVWLAEGLLVYLPAGQVKRLLSFVTELSTPGSRFGVTLRRLGDAPRPDEDGDPHVHVRKLWHPAGGVDPEQWLAGHGWQAEIDYPRAVLAAAGRDPKTEVDPNREPPRLMEAIRTLA